MAKTAGPLWEHFSRRALAKFFMPPMLACHHAASHEYVVERIFEGADGGRSH
jgi:hypothetical protein